MKVTESVKTRTVLVPFMCKLSIRPPKRYFIVSCHSGRARPAGQGRSPDNASAGWPGFLHTEPVTFTADPSAKTHYMPSPASTGQRTDNTGEGWGMKETQSHMTEGLRTSGKSSHIQRTKTKTLSPPAEDSESGCPGQGVCIVPTTQCQSGLGGLLRWVEAAGRLHGGGDLRGGSRSEILRKRSLGPGSWQRGTQWVVSVRGSRLLRRYHNIIVFV